MNTLIGVVYCSTMFDYKDNVFTSDIGTITGCLRQLWQEDMVCGFGIKSAKTDAIVFFTLDSFDEEDSKYVFKPTENCISRNPILNQIEVHIYK